MNFIVRLRQSPIKTPNIVRKKERSTPAGTRAPVYPYTKREYSPSLILNKPVRPAHAHRQLAVNIPDQGSSHYILLEIPFPRSSTLYLPFVYSSKLRFCAFFNIPPFLKSHRGREIWSMNTSLRHLPLLPCRGKCSCQKLLHDLTNPTVSFCTMLPELLRSTVWCVGEREGCAFPRSRDLHDRKSQR